MRKTHRKTKSRVYNVYNGMKQRCLNPNADNYKFYGGRGITICERWLESFENFYSDMGDPPLNYQLDRKDNSKGYSPENCEWVPPKVNCSNTRRNVKYEYNGEELTVSEIARRSGIHVETLRSRLKTGMPLEKALTKRKWSNG